MTAFDLLLVALLWLGTGNVFVCRDLGDYTGWHASTVSNGRGTIITIFILACAIWPIYFTKWAKGQ